MFDVAEGATLTINGPIDAPLVQVFAGKGKVAFGPGKIERVYPQWFGARGDGEHDDTAAIQAAIGSIAAGVVYLPAGRYANTGMTVHGNLSVLGAGMGASLLIFTPKTGSCLTLPPNCRRLHIEKMSLRSPNHTDGYGVDGTNEYVAHFSMREFSVIGFKTGVYIAQGMQITFDYGYVGCYGQGKANGTCAIKIGDYPTTKGCTTVTVRDMYLTNAEVDFYNRGAPCLMIRPIFETSQIGLDSYARNTLIAPFFAGNKKADARLTANGALFIGIGKAAIKVIYDHKTTENRTSFLPDTFDVTMKLGRMDLTRKGELTVDGKPVVLGDKPVVLDDKPVVPGDKPVVLGDKPEEGKTDGPN